MPPTKKAAARAAAPGAVASGTVATPGGVTAGTTTSPAGGTVGVVKGEMATTAESEFGVLGWFTVDAEGATVQFGINPQKYFLDATAANYNALFGMLLACWLEQRKVRLTYGLPRVVVTAAPDAPRRILSLVTLGVGV
jgi:hypothetical protein